MSDELNLQETQKEWHGTIKSYLIGFFGSCLLTGASFLLVMTKWLTGASLVYTILGLALVQAIVQLLYFLHVREGAKPRWEMLVFYFMVIILLIIVIGSLWIMNDLNDRMMSGMVMAPPACKPRDRSWSWG